MVTSWTNDIECKINNIDVSDCLLRMGVSGSLSNAIVSGNLEFNKRGLDTLVTVANAMSCEITRKYVVTVDGVSSNVNQVIFKGYCKTPEDSRGRTTVQVQDKLKKLSDSEINKTYGSSSVPVDLSEIFYDIVTSAGLTCTYNVTNATVQKSGVTTKGMTFSHCNSFTAAKQISDALGWQFYYNPSTDSVYLEARTYRSTNKPTYSNGDWGGSPKWTKDVSQLCNQVTVVPGETENVGVFWHTFETALSCTTGATLTLTIPKRPHYMGAGLLTSDGGGSGTMRGVSVGDITKVSRSVSSSFAYQPNRAGPNFTIYQNTWPNDAWEDTAYHDFPAGSKFFIQYKYNAPVPQTFQDTTSIATYGKVAKTITRSDLIATADISALGLQYLARFKDPLEQVSMNAAHTPLKLPWLGQLCDIVDAQNAKTRTSMAVVSFELNWPRKTDTIVLGELNAVTADYTTGLEERIKNLETTGLSNDYTQGAYTPLDPSGEEEEPGTGTPSSGGKVTVSAGVLNGPDGSAIHLKGTNDSATWCGFANARGSNYTPDSTLSCPVTNGGTAVNSSSAEAVATYFYRYGLALKTLGLNFVRMGAHTAWGLDALYTAWRSDSTKFDLVTKAMAQGFEEAGLYFQVCMSGFAETLVAEGGNGYENRQLLTTMTTAGTHLSATGHLTDNILHKDSASYDNFAAFCVHVGDLLADFPHFVALELSNEPDNWRQCPVYWSAQYGDDYSTGGTVEAAMMAWGSGLATKIRADRTKTFNITNGWTPLAGPPWHTRATVLPISNPGNLIRDLNTGMDIATAHVYHFSPIFCDSATPAATGNCDGTVCGQTNIQTAIQSACKAAGMPYLNDEWGRYCDSNQVYVSTIADTMTAIGVHWACIVPPSRPAIGSSTIPTGWDSLPVISNPAPAADYSYIVTVSSGTYTAKDVSGNTLTSGTNAATVIQAALTALGTGRTTKKAVLLQGNFTLTDAIEVPSYTTLVLDGKVTRGANDYMVYCNNVDYVDIIGGEWDGNQATYTTASIDGIALESCSNVVIGGTSDTDRMEIYGTTYHPINCVYSDHVTVQYVEAHDNGNWDVVAYRAPGVMFIDCQYCTVKDNYVHDTSKGGIYFYTPEGAGNSFSNSYNIVQDNIVERTYTSGIEMAVRGVSDVCTGNTVSGNTVIDGGMDGEHPCIYIGWYGSADGTNYYLKKATDCTVTDNETYETGSYPTSIGGIYLYADSSDCTGNNAHNLAAYGIACKGDSNTISTNTVDSAVMGGIALADADSNTITGNTLSHNTGPAVYLTASNNNTVTGNTLHSNGSNVVVESGTGNVTSPNTIS